jgi:hypothetical protein
MGVGGAVGKRLWAGVGVGALGGTIFGVNLGEGKTPENGWKSRLFRGVGGGGVNNLWMVDIEGVIALKKASSKLTKRRGIG